MFVLPLLSPHVNNPALALKVRKSDRCKGKLHMSSGKCIHLSTQWSSCVTIVTFNVWDLPDCTIIILNSVERDARCT